MRYILDFDHTLLDTDAFVQQVVLDGREHILITPDIWRYYNVRDFLYDDVIIWLNSKSKDDLHILTAMTPSLGELSCEFQREKLASGNFTELVSGITFMVGEKGEAAASIAQQWTPPEPLVFIDDRLDQCLSVQAALPHCHSFLMTRHGVLATDLPQGIIAVPDLAAVDGIMERLV